MATTPAGRQRLAMKDTPGPDDSMRHRNTGRSLTVEHAIERALTFKTRGQPG